ncbi:MAG: hypothetical protein SYC29_00005, partial [Planctomycetota bacterium]|nr:hypothetical protein [Planctomycetota bacterium]
RLEQRIRTVNAQIAETRQQLDDLKRSYAAAERRLQATGAVGPLPDWSVLLSALAAETGEHVVLSVCALEPTPAGEEAAGDEIRDPQRVGALTLLLTGFGRTQRDVSDFVLRLERISLLDSVSLVSSRREPFLTDHATAFEIRCSIGGEKGDAP